MGRIKHPEYATPPAFIHPTDIVRGFVDPDEAARRWNAHDALVRALQNADKALAALIVTFHEEAPKCSKGYTFPALVALNALRDTLGRVDGPK